MERNYVVSWLVHGHRYYYRAIETDERDAFSGVNKRTRAARLNRDDAIRLAAHVSTALGTDARPVSI